MKYFAIEAKNDVKSKSLEKRLEKELIGMGFLYDELHPDFVVIIGGDGKLIRSVHKYLEQLDQIRFITIMTGTLGFYMNHYEEDIPDLLAHLKSRDFQESTYSLLEVETDRKTKFYALNEVRLENRIRTSIINVSIDGFLFETFRGNGLVISTPFGSSAYNRSLGGAIISDELEVMQLTEIAGIHHNSYRSLNNSLVLGKNRVITLGSEDIKNSIIGYDHLNFLQEGIHQISIRFSDKKVHIINKKGYTYFHRLRSSFMY